MQTKKNGIGWKMTISQKEIDDALNTVREGLIEKGKTMYKKELEAGTVTIGDIEKQADKFVDRLDEEIFKSRRKEMGDGRYQLLTRNANLVEVLISTRH